MTAFEPATQDQNAAHSKDLPFFPEKTLRRIPRLPARPHEPITSAELFALQRRFDRFIGELNPPRTRKI